jgi:prepilin-type N-terminal cleavage/methylation domain-containing protein/prepilin-type processing-associated H-X9-DG protein
MKLGRRRNSGFTLVELLVVIAIIGILVALLLPAIQAAREAARRSSCSNNLKQMTLAMLTYHDTAKQFPRGAYTAMPGQDRPENGLGWATKLLPQIEEQAIYDRIVRNTLPVSPTLPNYQKDAWQPWILLAANMNGQRPFAGGDTLIAAFRCPSADLPTHAPTSSTGATTVHTGYAGSHYKASRGPCDRGMFWRTEEGFEPDTCTMDYDSNGDGVVNAADELSHDRMTRVRIQDVTDGTSKTIAVGEAAYFFEADDFPIWMGTTEEDGAILFKTERTIGCNISAVKSFPITDEEKVQLDGGEDDCTFSWHNGGAMFGFVDGSVQFLSDGLEVRVFALLGDRFDGETIPSY